MLELYPCYAQEWQAFRSGVPRLVGAFDEPWTS